jgi:hypothetical protein
MFFYNTAFVMMIIQYKFIDAYNMYFSSNFKNQNI